MALSPREIETKTFEPVTVGGVDGDAVARFLVEVARSNSDLQRELAEAHQQIRHLTERCDGKPAEVGAGGAAAMAATASEIAALRAAAEAEIEAYRQETVEHANRRRAEVEAALADMQREAEVGIRAVHSQVVAELVHRAEVIAATERALIDRLEGTAGDLHEAIDHLRRRQAQGSAALDTALGVARADVLVPVPDLDLTASGGTHRPPPPIASPASRGGSTSGR